MNFLSSFMTRPKKWNILLDFDKTVAGGHSGGRVFTPTSPMDSRNQEVFKSNVINWLHLCTFQSPIYITCNRRWRLLGYTKGNLSVAK